MQSVIETKQAPTFDATHRCDKCNARALARAWNVEGSELLFCGHHGRKFKEGLIAQGFIIEFQELDKTN